MNVAPSKGTVARGGSAMPCHAYMLITYHPGRGYHSWYSVRAPLHGDVLASGPCGISLSRLLRGSVDFVPVRRAHMVARQPTIVSGVSWYITERDQLP